MRRKAAFLLSGVLCLTGLVQLYAVESTLIEKGRSRAKVRVAYREKKSPGLKGLVGPVGAQGPERLPVYATAYQSIIKIINGGETEVVVPFDTMQEAKGISLSNDTFILPRGTYRVHFQFTLNNWYTTGAFPFSDVHLVLGDGSSIPLSWSAAYNNLFEITFSDATSVTGSKIFSIPSDNMGVRLIFTRTSGTDFSFSDYVTVENHPTRIVFHRV